MKKTLHFILFFFTGMYSYAQLPKECIDKPGKSQPAKTPAQFHDERNKKIPAFEIMDEEGPHSVAFEGWYFYGYLRSEESHEDEWLFFSSFQQTVFGRYLLLNLIDLKSGEKNFYGIVDNPLGLVRMPDSHYSFSKTERTKKEGTSVLNLSWEGNIFQKDKKGYRSAFTNPYFQMDLSMWPLTSPMHVLGTGLTGLARADKLHYYAFPRLNGYGTLMKDSSEKQICGQFWYEHIWGGVWPPKLVKWNWWSLQLPTGETMTISLIKNRRNKILQQYISLQDLSGITTSFTKLDFEILEYWRSPHSSINHPVKWKITIPEWKYDLTVSAMFNDCEIPVIGTGFLWEGPCEVEAKDKASGKIIKGKGIQENVGYGKN